MTALYVLVEGEWVSYILGAPDFVNEDFGELYAGGVPALTPLVAKSEGPASPAPDGPVVTDPVPACLQGVIADGFSLVVSEGGSVEELAACAQSRDVAAVYALGRRRVGVLHPRRAGVRQTLLPGTLRRRCPHGHTAGRQARLTPAVARRRDA